MVETQEAFYEVAPYFIESNVNEEGKIEFANRRFVFFHTEMFSRLFQKMEDVAGPVIRRKIEQFGVESGKYIGKKMDEDLKDKSLGDALTLVYRTGFNIEKIRKVVDTSTESQFRKILGYAKHVGWMGDTHVKEFSESKAKVVVENTFESDSYGETGRKECDYIKGTFKGIMIYFWDDEEIEVEELKCASEGHDHCVMEVTRDV